MKFVYAPAVEIQPKALESEGNIGSSDFSIDVKKARFLNASTLARIILKLGFNEARAITA